MELTLTCIVILVIIYEEKYEKEYTTNIYDLHVVDWRYKR